MRSSAQTVSAQSGLPSRARGPVGRGRRRWRPQRAHGRRLPGSRRPSGAGAGAGRAGRRCGRVDGGARRRGAVPGRGRAAVALLLPGQPAAPADRRRPRSRRPPGAAPRVVLHPGPRRPGSRAARRRRRGRHASLVRPSRRGRGPRGLDRAVRRHATPGEGGVPDADRPPAHPRRAAGTGGRRRPVDGAGRAPARGADHGDAAQRPGARRGRDRRAHRHARPPRRPVTGREPVLPLPRDRQRDRPLGRSGRRDGHGGRGAGAGGAGRGHPHRHRCRGDRDRPRRPGRVHPPRRGAHRAR